MAQSENVLNCLNFKDILSPKFQKVTKIKIAFFRNVCARHSAAELKEMLCKLDMQLTNFASLALQSSLMTNFLIIFLFQQQFFSLSLLVLCLKHNQTCLPPKCTSVVWVV